MMNLDDRGRIILQNFGIIVGSCGLLLIGWETMHDGDWHLWLGFLLVLVGAVCIFPPIVSPLVTLSRAIAPFVPGTAARRARKTEEVSATMISRAISRLDAEQKRDEQKREGGE